MPDRTITVDGSLPAKPRQKPWYHQVAHGSADQQLVPMTSPGAPHYAKYLRQVANGTRPKAWVSPDGADPKALIPLDGSAGRPSAQGPGITAQATGRSCGL